MYAKQKKNEKEQLESILRFLTKNTHTVLHFVFWN